MLIRTLLLILSGIMLGGCGLFGSSSTTVIMEVTGDSLAIVRYTTPSVINEIDTVTTSWRDTLSVRSDGEVTLKGKGEGTIRALIRTEEQTLEEASGTDSVEVTAEVP